MDVCYIVFKDVNVFRRTSVRLYVRFKYKIESAIS